MCRHTSKAALGSDTKHVRERHVHRTTMADLARAANVSLSTVDRVLNGRLPVRRDKAERVVTAATDLGFHAAGLLRQRVGSEPPKRRFGFILQQPADHFHGLLGRALAQATRADPAIRGEPHVEFVDGVEATVTVERLKSVARKVDAIAIVAADHPRLSEAVDDVVRSGVPVVALISKLQCERSSGFIGLDNRKVGRTAGWALSHLCAAPGKVGISLGSHRYHCQHTAEESCRAYLREHSPYLGVVDSPTNFEQPRFAYENARDLLDRHPDLTGLFVAGGGLEGVMNAITEAGVAGRLVAIGRELTPESRMGLINGTLSLVISHPITAMAEAVVKALTRAHTVLGAFQEILLPIELYTSESL